MDRAESSISRNASADIERPVRSKDTNGRWAISPDRSDEILSLKLDRDFALLVDLSADPVRN
jgi:hypothetical protein